MPRISRSDARHRSLPANRIAPLVSAPSTSRSTDKAVIDFPEVVEFYRMSGEVDYLLHVVVPDIAGYDAVYKRLIAKIELSDVSSSFAMEVIKETTRLPVTHLR